MAANRAAANVILENKIRNSGLTGTLLLYRLVQYLCFPAIVLYFLARLVLRPQYWLHFSERLGVVPSSFRRTVAGSIWLHAVSVGEVAAAPPLIHALRQRHPDTLIYLSVGTVAGRRAAYRHAAQLVDGIFYAPIDYASCIRRVIRALQPALLVVLETEIWPNLYAELKGSGASVAVVNARISDRALPRYRRVKRWTTEVLRLPDMVLAQSSRDAERYLQLGAPAARVFVSGNLKYDAALHSHRHFAMPNWGTEQVWVAASTVGPNERGSSHRDATDEDDVVIEVFRRLAPDFPKLLLILAPRQPARFDGVAGKLKKAGIAFRRWTRLHEEADLKLPGVLLLDTIGELSAAYSRASVAFLGGSIAPRGGHNFLEPAAAGVPIIVGPHMHNFAATLRDFLDERALEQIHSAEELAPAVSRLLKDRERAALLGMRGRATLEAHQGVAANMAERLGPLLHNAFMRKPRNLFASAALTSLAALWTRGGRRKRARGLCEARAQAPFGTPIISVGGITMGGAGKTPFCNYLASEFRKRGFKPAILTRGYRRRSPATLILLPAGSHVPSALTGDEAQIFLNAGNASVGISDRRYSAAAALLAEDPGIGPLLLDDGFQHARMRRDFDVVLIDALDPFGGEEVFPKGRLREPLSALKRADAIVITRPGDSDRAQAIRRRVASYNSIAPVFTARQCVETWCEFVSGRQISIESGSRVAAFCGLGNPQSFWNTLNGLGLSVALQWGFGDHHQYRPVEIQRLVHQAGEYGAKYLVTTEKDAINLPPDTARLLSEIPLVWLKAGLALSDPGAFFAHLDQALVPRT